MKFFRILNMTMRVRKPAFSSVVELDVKLYVLFKFTACLVVNTSLDVILNETFHVTFVAVQH